MIPDPAFQRREGELHCEGVSLRALAEEYGTPLYVYSAEAFLGAFHRVQRAFSAHPTRVAYAVKASSNLNLLALLAAEGGGADIVSGGELERALRAGIPPERISFAGVGKSRAELRRALEAGIDFISVESFDELELLDEVGRAFGRPAPTVLRVNPDVDPGTHPYVATGLKTEKFGIPIDQALAAWPEIAARTGLKIRGLHSHVGSQVSAISAFTEALDRTLEAVTALRAAGAELEIVDIGGGFGIAYEDEEPLDVEALAAAVLPRIASLGLELVVEPGRFLAGPAGVLLTEVQGNKDNEVKRFLVVDAAMTELIRPALYGSYHPIVPVGPPREGASSVVDIVGPVCESGDFLATDRELPPCKTGDLLAVLQAGAYGMSMSSNYNSRPRPPEILVQGDQARLIRRRERFDDLIACEIFEA